MEKHWGMAVKVERCFGCKICTISCKSENYAQFVPEASQLVEENPVFWVRVQEEISGNYPEFTARYYPTICRHCQNPSCLAACPTQAIIKRHDGIVVISQDDCNGCGLCITACPYQAPQQNVKTGRAEMCHFCLHRLDKGEEPVCVTACPAKALIFGDLNDENSELSTLISSRQPIQLPQDPRNLPSVYLLTT